MYERFYNLRERPFSLTPDPDYLYPSRVHKEALSYLRYGIDSNAGFTVITGEIGSGKTTLLQAVLRGLDERTAVSRLVNTMLDARELIEAVMLDFGIDPERGRSKPHLLRDLAQYLVGQRAAGRVALLVIDEAQNLSFATLEEVRMLSNLETEKSKLIQIAMVGQPNLRDVMARPELEQLRQRVTVSYHLRPLDAADTAAYVNHRLRRAAIGAPLEFPRNVSDLIHLHSQGVPRKINVIADAVLLFGYGEDQRAISVDLAQQAIDELEAIGVITARSQAEPEPRRAPVPAAVDSELAARETLVAERERQLVARERQLVEQQRVLSEQMRLLQQRRDAAPGTATWPSAWPETGGPMLRRKSASTAPPTPRVPPARTVAPPAHLLVETGYEDTGLWARLRRGLFGDARPAYED